MLKPIHLLLFGENYVALSPDHVKIFYRTYLSASLDDLKEIVDQKLAPGKSDSKICQ